MSLAKMATGDGNTRSREFSLHAWSVDYCNCGKLRDELLTLFLLLCMGFAQSEARGITWWTLAIINGGPVGHMLLNASVALHVTST